MKRKLIYPSLVGKMIQKIEEDEDGNVIIHTKAAVVKIAAWRYAESHGLTLELALREP